MIFVVFFIAFILLLNSYVIFATWSHFDGTMVAGLWKVFLVLMPLWEMATVIIMYGQFKPDFGKSSWLTNLGMGVSFAFFATKFVIVCFLLLNDSYRLIRWPIENILSSESVPLEGRRRVITNIGLSLAAVPFLSLLYGTFKGKYSYKVWEQRLDFPDLPKNFSGLRIAQLSDIHSGSFDDAEAVRAGLKLLMTYKPDLILLTGDLVNNFATEIDDFIDIFRDELVAPFGKYAVMGNHDYGEYVEWESEESKQENIQAVKDRYAALGFKLLNNEATILDLKGERIALVGVENWGSGHFPKYGDFDKAIEKIEPADFKILMSHDPDHWEHKIIDHDVHVNLTLSGHTHGSQLGVEIPGWIKFAPVQLRYKRWAGLYQEKDQYLYVNRGFGFIGYPGRFGIWPEITIMDLHSGSVLDQA